MKLADSLRMKYSLARLRPPTMANALSAMNSLLCMRRLMRVNSCRDSTMRAPNVPVRGEAGEQLVLARGVEVVDEHAHAHAARGRVAQLAQQQQADLVGSDQVVLQVQRLLCAADQRDARVQRMVAIHQRAKAGQVSRIVGRRGCDD